MGDVELMTVMEFYGQEEAVMRFVCDLRESGGDVRLVMYRAIFDLWNPPALEDRERAEILAGSALCVDLEEGLLVDRIGSMATATLTMVDETSLLRDAICLGALYKFEVNTSLVDQETGLCEQVSLDL